MRIITIILKNIRIHLPYFLLIAIYFFFINLEARKDKNNKLNSEKVKIITENKSSFDEKNLKIRIPVIPYNK
tara:strand:+ start:1514 stop:1729 length:216 start_codon:yes stop_codon:yes gene_type:complete